MPKGKGGGGGASKGGGGGKGKGGKGGKPLQHLWPQETTNNTCMHIFKVQRVLTLPVVEGVKARRLEEGLQ